VASENEKGLGFKGKYIERPKLKGEKEDDIGL